MYIPQINSSVVNALRVTESGGGSVVMSKQGLDDMEEMDLLLPRIGVFGMKIMGKSLAAYDIILFQFQFGALCKVIHYCVIVLEKSVT